MDPLSTVLFADNSTLLPDTVFKPLDRAWCTIFIQDAKIDMSEETMKTCEFGLALSSLFGKWTGLCNPLERAAKILNSKHHPRIWLMASKEIIAQNEKNDGAGAVWPIVSQALKSSKNNLLELDDLRKKKDSFPTPYEQSGSFNPHKISTYYAIGLTPYFDIPVERFSNITGKYPTQPRILMLDEGPVGPPIRVYNYKHLTRLVMNGTLAADQNPSYVIIEIKYTKELAPFLKKKFPDDTKLVLKQPASTRGEGVVILDASSLEILDKQLLKHLSEGTEFRNHSVLSICLVESFISTPAKTTQEGTQETIVRVVNLVVQDNSKMEFYPVAAGRCFEDLKSHKDDSTLGMVKLGKLNDGRFEDFSQEQLDRIRNKHFAEITTFAKRAISYNSDAAVEHFLSCENHILNLVGVELFCPILVAKYRERIFIEEYNYIDRLKEEHCQLLINLLKRNKSLIIRERILLNIMLPEIKSMFCNPLFPACKSLNELLKMLDIETQDVHARHLLKNMLIKNYINLSIGFPQDGNSLKFILDGLMLLKSFKDVTDRLRLESIIYILQVSPIMMQREAGVDYYTMLKNLNIKNIPSKIIQQIIQAIEKKNGSKYAYDLYRYLFRFHAEEQSMKSTWSETEWNFLLDRMNELKEPQDAIQLLWLLPEAFQIGWKPSQLTEVIKLFFKSPNAKEYVTFYGAVIRFFAQHKGTHPAISHAFIIKIANFDIDPQSLILLLSWIQEETLTKGQDINLVLISTCKIIDEFLQKSGPGNQSFKNCVAKIAT